MLGQEDVGFEIPALRLIGQAASGSMRDALSLTDQAIAYSAGNLTEDAVRGMLGTIDQRHLVRLLDALSSGDAKGVLAVADELAIRGLSYAGALADLAVLLSRVAIEQRVTGVTAAEDPLAADIARLAQALHPDAVQLFYSVAVHSRGELTLAPDEYAGFIMACLRMLALNGDAGPQTALEAPATPARQTAAPAAAAAIAAPTGAGAGASSPDAASTAASSTAAVSTAAVSTAAVPTSAQSADAPSAAAPSAAAQPAAAGQPIAARPDAGPSGPTAASAPAHNAAADDAPAGNASATAHTAATDAAFTSVPNGAAAPTADPVTTGASTAHTAMPGAPAANASAPFDGAAAAAAATPADGSASSPDAAHTPSMSSANDAAASAQPAPPAAAAPAQSSAASAPQSADTNSVPPWEDLPADAASLNPASAKAQNSAALAVTPAAAAIAPAVDDAEGPPAWVDEEIPFEAEGGFMPDSGFTSDPDDDFETLATSPSPAPAPPAARRDGPAPARKRQSRAPRLADMDAASWPELAARLPVTGLASELARQSEWAGVQGDAIILRVAVKTLAESESRVRLQTVLCEHFGQGIRLDVRVGVTGDATAYAVAQAESAARQLAAENAVADDPFVQALLADFGGHVVPGSIRHVDSSAAA